jgi:hypothetical protein
VAALAEFRVQPASWEPSFCTVRGSSEQDRPMLDSICAELTRSADATPHSSLRSVSTASPSTRVRLEAGLSRAHYSVFKCHADARLRRSSLAYRTRRSAAQLDRRVACRRNPPNARESKMPWPGGMGAQTQ